jgi:hypothetical protein
MGEPGLEIGGTDHLTPTGQKAAQEPKSDYARTGEFQGRLL